MRVIIAGSRSIKGRKAVELINKAINDSGWTVNEVISGGAIGVDEAGIDWAKENDADYVIMNANWKKWGKGAGYKRNQKMAWYAAIFNNKREASTDGLKGLKPLPDKLKGGCIAVWDGKSKGTGHMIDIAREMGLDVFVLTV